MALLTGKSALGQDLLSRIEQLQRGPASEYLEVSVPEYAETTELYTRSRLYPDHLELRADLRLRGSYLFDLEKAKGGIDDNGIGEKHYFGQMNPCSDLKPKKGTDKTSYFELSGTVCVENDHLVLTLRAYTEFSGEAAARYSQFAQCNRGKNGGCIMSNNEPTSFAIFLSGSQQPTIATARQTYKWTDLTKEQERDFLRQCYEAVKSAALRQHQRFCLLGWKDAYDSVALDGKAIVTDAVDDSGPISTQGISFLCSLDSSGRPRMFNMVDYGLPTKIDWKIQQCAVPD